jgi:hypothetical protein
VNESSLFRYPFTLSLKRGKRLLSETRALGVAIVHRTKVARTSIGAAWKEVFCGRRTRQSCLKDNSLLLHLTDDQVRFLWPGGIQNKVQDELAREHAVADFLKPPHPGSKTVLDRGLSHQGRAPRGGCFPGPGESLRRTDRDGAVGADGGTKYDCTSVCPTAAEWTAPGDPAAVQCPHVLLRVFRFRLMIVLQATPAVDWPRI